MASLFPAEQVTITPLKKEGQYEMYNLMIKIPGEQSNQPLIFSGHTDTVPATNQWTRDPFKLEVIDDKIFGLGSTDMKAGVAAFLSATLQLTSKPKQDIYLLLDADEEDLGTGGKDFVNQLNLTNANIIVAEPSDNKIMIGQKGAFSMKVNYFGVAEHASRTCFENNQKNSAIYKALAAIYQLQTVEKCYPQQEIEQYGCPTLNIGKINGGVASNVVPSECSFTIDRRILPNENIQSVIEEFTQILKTVDSQVQIEILFTGEAFNLDQNSELYKTLIDIQSKYFVPETTIMTGWTQAGLFKKWGTPVIFGPGLISQAHKADEYCPLDDLEKFTVIYLDVIKQLACYE